MLGLLLGTTLPAAALTYVNRSNPNDPSSAGSVTLTTRTWTTAGDPYIIEGRVFVGFGQTLTIQPGVVVQVNGAHGIYVSGRMVADGTDASPIIFTAPGRPSAGDWLGIAFTPDDFGSVMDHCEVRYAGALAGLGSGAGGGRKAAVFVNSADVTITNGRILSSETNGIELASSAGLGGGSQQVSTIQNVSFENIRAGYYAILNDDVNCFPVVSGNSATGSGYLGIGLGWGQLDASNTWRRGGADFPYFLRGTVEVPFQRTLTVSPGVTVKALGNHRIWVDGSLRADGTAALPITFTSGLIPPGRGNWGGIFFSSTATLNGLLDNCRIEYASTGVEIGNSDPVIRDCAFAEMSVAGISVAQSGFSNPPVATIQNNTFQNFNIAAYPIIYENMHTFPVISGNTSTGGVLRPGVRLPGGHITNSNAVYPVPGPGMAYYATGDIFVDSGKGLTIPAGNTFRMGAAGFYADGRLQILGTEQNPVVLTSAGLLPEPGAWKGIHFRSSSDASVINFCEIAYAGSELGSAGSFSAIRAEAKAVVMDHLHIRHPKGHGIRLRDSASAVAASTFENIEAPYAAVYLETSNTFPSVTGNTASGTGRLGILVRPGNVTAPTIGTWEKGGEDFPWLVDGNYTIDNGAVLNVSAGARIELAGGLYLNGTFVVSGTPEDKVRFTSQKDAPAPGDWRGLYIGPTASFSSIAWTEIAYAGSDLGLGTYNGAVRRAALYVDTNNVTIANVQVLHSENNGVEVFNASGPIRNMLVWGCGLAGLRLEGGAAQLIHNATLVGNVAGVSFAGGTLALANSVVAYNNVGFQQTAAANAALAFNTVWENAVADYAGLPDPTGTANNTRADPRFAAPGAGNVRLKPGSPCIDSGNSALVPAGAKDLDGKARILGAAVDRGAYEASVFAPYTMGDVSAALRVAAGLQACSVDDVARLNVETADASAARIDARDADRLLRALNGLDTLP